MNDTMKQTAALLVMAGAGNVAAPTPKSKAGKVVKVKLADMTLEQHDAATDAALGALKLSNAQTDALEMIAVYAEDIRYTIESKREAIATLCVILFPIADNSTDTHFATSDALTWERYSAMTRYLRPRSQHAYREFRRAVLDVFGVAPTAADARAGKGRKKGASPKTWFRGVNSTLSKLVKRANKCPSKDVDADVLRAFVAAMRACEVAAAKLGKRIAA